MSPSFSIRIMFTLKQQPMSLLSPVTVVTEESNVLVFLATLYYQDKERHEEAVLSAGERARSRILIFSAITTVVFWDDIERRDGGDWQQQNGQEV